MFSNNKQHQGILHEQNQRPRCGSPRHTHLHLLARFPKLGQAKVDEFQIISCMHWWHLCFLWDPGGRPNVRKGWESNQISMGLVYLPTFGNEVDEGMMRVYLPHVEVNTPVNTLYITCLDMGFGVFDPLIFLDREGWGDGFLDGQQFNTINGLKKLRRGKNTCFWIFLPTSRYGHEGNQKQAEWYTLIGGGNWSAVYFDHDLSCHWLHLSVKQFPKDIWFPNGPAITIQGQIIHECSYPTGSTQGIARYIDCDAWIKSTSRDFVLVHTKYPVLMLQIRLCPPKSKSCHHLIVLVTCWQISAHRKIIPHGEPTAISTTQLCVNRPTSTFWTRLQCKWTRQVLLRLNWFENKNMYINKI